LFVIEFLKGSISFLRTVFMGELIVVIATCGVGQHEISLAYVRELPLSGNSAGWVLFRMPFSSELLIGVFNLGLGSFVGET